MSKVKKSKGKSKTYARKSRSSGPSPIEAAREFIQQYALAGVAGVIVILASAGAILWAGGYVGILTDKMARAADAGAVAAGFEIRRITLKGRTQTASDELEGAIGPILGASILSFDADQARARIEELGWVRVASVSRLLPNTIHVSIRERSPAAVWQMSGALHLIDIDGAIIREIGAYEYSNLPLIVGAGAPDAASGILQALAHHPDIAEMTSALVRVGERRWNVRLRNGVDLRLPDEGFADSLD
ncbi:MAG TPA: FtsQ-type POTRA domain-containing protein, partial [Amphiplicatus sp.]|nr:FtsQ-type POTRA domain-containing protein [Amphiplicatus sp.]